jgi:hypothetical protein
MPSSPALLPIVEQLRRVRARARGILVATASSTLVSVATATMLAVIAIDYLFRLPGWLRGGMLLIGIGAAVYAIQRWIVPALRFRPPLTEVALRLEGSDEGKAAGLHGVLASAIELADHPEPTPAGSWMSQRVVETARQRFGTLRASSILSGRNLRDSGLVAAFCIAAALGVSMMAGSDLTRTGLTRVLAPWSGAQWPKRTAIADATGLEVHPLGTALPLRAVVERTRQAEGQTRITARYRVVGSGDPTRTLVLTGQGIAPDRPGEVYERLIEPAVLAGAGDGDSSILEYWFESDDDRTPPKRIRLIRPPAVLAAEATIEPPGYAAGTPGNFVSGRHDLGGGTDQRAVVGPVLAGSKIDMTLRLNKPVPPPPEEPAEHEAWRHEALAGAEGDLAPSGDRWTLSWLATQSVRMPVRPTDEFGIRAGDDSTFSFDIVEDRPPSATVVEPREDESVLATAKVEVVGEGRDDVGVRHLSLLTQAAKPARGSMGAAPEPVGEPAVATERAFGNGGGGTVMTQSSLRTVIDLASLPGVDLQAGDELWIFAAATDNFELDGRTHAPVRSSPRKLRIIREEDLIQQVRGELSGVRRGAMRLEEEQRDLKRTVQDGAVSADDERRQSGIAQRTQQQGETIQRLQDRLDRNQLRDEALAGLLSDIGSLLREASREAESAASQMEQARARSAEDEDAQLSPGQAESIERAQDQVRDRLAQVAESLDRGEDSWVLSRTLERLAEQQRELQSRTQRAGERTMGKRAQDLTPQERGELQDIAEQQQRLSDAAQRALEQLAERAQQMENVDATQSEAMKRAAERGRQNEVPEKMQEASQNIQQNQTSSAGAQQQEAIEALEQMLQDMNDAQRNRDQALRRILATLMQSLDRLIAEQDAQIAALEAAREGEAFAGLDAPMITLNTNTLAVAETARSDRATASIADIIDRASRSQERAIASLRAAPVEDQKAEEHERESLRLLRLAKAEARKLEQQAEQRETDRKRAELRRAYRDALEEQVAIQGQTEPLIGRAVDRRERMQVRALGERQEALRASLDELRKETGEIDEAGVFSYAHERLDAATGIAGKKLRAGQADRAVSRNQESAIRILHSLMQALDDAAQEDDEFRDEQQDESGGGGGGQSGEQPLIPPFAELKLLRGMQQEAMEVTRAIDEARESAAPEELAAIAEFQRSLHQRADELVQKLQPQQLPAQPGKESP